jgi:PucR C-terminal helix-turn-helix domain
LHGFGGRSTGTEERGGESSPRLGGRFVVALQAVPPGAAATTATTRFGRRLAETAAAAGTPAWVATAWSPRPRLLDAYREACRVLRLVRRHRLPPDAYSLLSVMAPYLVGGDPLAAERLRGLLDGLAHTPYLVETLRAWLAGDLDRRRVAAALHVHPNTLDRRLRRIERLVGLSVTRHNDLHLLHLALAAVPPPAGPVRLG